MMINTKRYYILRGVGFLYKVLAILSVLIAFGGIGFLLINFVGLPDVERLALGRYNILWQQMFGSLIVGLLFCLLFATLGQMIDVILTTSDNVLSMAEMTQREIKLLEALHKDKTSAAPNRIKIPME